MSIIKTKRKNHDKIVLLATKQNLDSIKVLNSKAASELFIMQDEFVSLNNVGREFDDLKTK